MRRIRRDADVNDVARRLDGPEDVARAIGIETDPLPRLALDLPDAHLLRHVALPRDPAQKTFELRVRFDHWEAPVPRWRGRLGQVRGLTGYDL